MYIEKDEYGADIDGNRGITVNTPVVEDSDHDEIRNQLLDELKENGYLNTYSIIELEDAYERVCLIEVKTEDYITEEEMECKQ